MDVAKFYTSITLPIIEKEEYRKFRIIIYRDYNTNTLPNVYLESVDKFMTVKTNLNNSWINLSPKHRFPYIASHTSTWDLISKDDTAITFISLDCEYIPKNTSISDSAIGRWNINHEIYYY